MGVNESMSGNLLPVLPKQFSGAPGLLPVGIHRSEDALELGIFFTFLHNGQIVAKRTQARLEFLMIQVTSLVLVKVPVEEIEVECKKI